MPEENLIMPVQSSPKAAKKKSKRKKKPEKSPFKLSDNFDVKPAMPKSEFKIKGNSSADKRSQTGPVYGKLALTFIILTVVLVAIVAYFGFSSLIISIIPTQEKVSGSLAIEVINNAVSESLATGQISGAVRQVPVEQNKTFSASGKEVLGEEVIGQVTIINNYVKNQPLVATTRLLSSDNKLFRLKNTVNVPAGGRVTAEVYADVATPEMAVAPGRFTIPGLWAGIQDKIYAESQAPMKYSEIAKYIIKQSDIDGAVAELKNSLLASAKNQVGQAYGEYSQALFQIDNNSVSQEVSGKVGEEKENFSVKMKVMVTVVAFNDAGVFEQSKARLADTLADDKTILEFDKTDLVYFLEGVNLTQGQAMVKVDYVAKTTLKDSAGIIKKNNLSGLTLDQLKNYLNSLPEVSGYEIKFFPSFIKKAPNLVDRIKIEIVK